MEKKSCEAVQDYLFALVLRMILELLMMIMLR